MNALPGNVEEWFDSSVCWNSVSAIWFRLRSKANIPEQDISKRNRKQPFNSDIYVREKFYIFVVTCKFSLRDSTNGYLTVSRDSRASLSSVTQINIRDVKWKSAGIKSIQHDRNTGKVKSYS